MSRHIDLILGETLVLADGTTVTARVARRDDAVVAQLMDLDDQNPEPTVSNLGGPTAVAKALRLAAPTVHGWKRIPEQHCPDIERWKNGEFTVETMRPDVKWQRVPDSSWPHPQGRPLLDVTRVAVGA